MRNRQRRASFYLLLVGLTAVAAVVVLYNVGLLDALENQTLDLRFVYANSIPESPDIVCIDIDDGSLQKVGRWPWPRDLQAALISVPAECGAKAILVDLSLMEPEPVRTVVPRLLQMLGSPLSLLSPLDAQQDEPPRVAFPDLELRRAIADAGNVYLAAIADPNQWDHGARFRVLVQRLQAGAATAALRSTPPVGGLSGAELVHAARVAAALAADVSQSEADLSVCLGLDPNFVRGVYNRCLRFALTEWLRQALQAAPASGPAEPREQADRLFAALRPGASMAEETALRDAFLHAVEEFFSYSATLGRGGEVFGASVEVASIAVESEGVMPVYHMFAEAARRCGFVTFTVDADKVMRRTALFVRHDRRVLPQLAFALACDLLGVGPERIRAAARGLSLIGAGRGGSDLLVQLDAGGAMLVPWAPRTDWTQQFGKHVPADALWQVADRRALIEQNRRLARREHARFFAHSGLFPREAAGAYAELFADREACAVRAEKYRLDPRAAELAGAPRELGQIDAAIADLEQRLIAGLRARLARPASAPATQAASEPFELRQVRNLEAEDARIRDVNLRLQAEIDELLEKRLKPRLAGKVCLVGYTATALADMTPIPTNPRAPGVMAHANLLSGFLTGRLVYWMPGWGNVLLAIVLGGLSTLISIHWRPRQALGAVLLLVTGYLALAALAFYLWAYWVAVIPVVGAVLLSYVAVQVFQYIVVDRERRELATALSQYTSKQIAQKVAEDPELCKKAEMREVTAMFTDLRGFTGISERIGAQRTQKVLNVCLGTFTEVMLRHEGMVNKFLGDGVFAFWNPVIHPQQDHALRACEAAADLMAAMEQLRARQHHNGDEVFAELVLRVGVATGNAIVGPCGSEQKFDYTCIGDSVNVASRLESANKFFGTNVLVGDATQAQAGQRFLFRPLGGVRVKGKERAVQVYELVGRPGQVPADAVAYVEQFGAAVRAFQARAWSEALERFRACLALRRDDPATERYLELLPDLMQHPPGPDWNGALELTEK